MLCPRVPPSPHCKVSLYAELENMILERMFIDTLKHQYNLLQITYINNEIILVIPQEQL